MAEQVRRLVVFRCTNPGCQHIIFSSYDWIASGKKKAKTCNECGSGFTKIGDSYHPEQYPDVKFQYKGKTPWGDDFIIAYFKTKCKGCGETVWLPWVKGGIDYDACQTCLSRQDAERSVIEAHEKAQREDDDSYNLH